MSRLVGEARHANLFWTIGRCRRIRFVRCDIPPIKQQMGGYSAIATGAGTIDVMADFRFCDAECDRSERFRGGRGDRLIRIYTVAV
jgi:hypothetical protein